MERKFMVRYCHPLQIIIYRDTIRTNIRSLGQTPVAATASPRALRSRKKKTSATRIIEVQSGNPLIEEDIERTEWK